MLWRKVGESGGHSELRGRVGGDKGRPNAFHTFVHAQVPGGIAHLDAHVQVPERLPHLCQCAGPQRHPHLCVHVQ
eukprot:237821-Chlamydomonas_euryale.AAC.1